MRSTRIVLMVAAAALASYSADAMAVNSVEDAYGGQGSHAVVGMDPNWYNTQWIGWKDPFTGDCSWELIGDSNGLYDDTSIYGQGGADKITVLSSNLTWCGYALTPPILGGRWIEIWGGDGNDELTSMGTYDIWLQGENHHDYVKSGRADAIIEGHAGNDVLRQFSSSGSGSQLYGGDDNDCLYNSNPSPAAVSCGNGTDQYFGTGSTPGDCETNSCDCVAGPWIIIC